MTVEDALRDLVRQVVREEMAAQAPPGRAQLLSVAEACRWTGMSRTALMGAIARGEVRSFKVGARRFIPADAIGGLAGPVGDA